MRALDWIDKELHDFALWFTDPGTMYQIYLSMSQ